MTKRIAHEAILHTKVARYIKSNYPDLIFKSNLDDGMKRNWSQRQNIYNLNSDRAYPDLFIAYPTEEYHGLFIELKADGVTVYKKNGELSSNPHIQEQAEMLDRLTGLGYRASFAKGFEEARELIDDYIGVGDTASDGVVF